jgi:hypothetical protein
MSNAVARIHADEADYMARFSAKQDQIANDANTGRTKFTEGMAEMCAMQQQEILRLNRIIRDNVTIPLRHPTTVSVSVGFRSNNIPRTTLFAVASDNSMWVMDRGVGAEAEYREWQRVRNLPQASDEADGGR